MSLRSFHILFVSVVLMLALLGSWALGQSELLEPQQAQFFRIGGLLFSGALLLYFFWFLRKTKQLEN